MSQQAIFSLKSVDGDKTVIIKGEQNKCMCPFFIDCAALLLYNLFQAHTGLVILWYVIL